ncbi:MAG: hypothetical protein CME17_02540, partial [Gemmatimonadetes bacterium]|nr:hypothetical protein [Gemmatimonadota bacterium]
MGAELGHEANPEVPEKGRNSMNSKHVLTLGALGLSIALAPPPAFGQQAAPGNMNILIVCGDE